MKYTLFFLLVLLMVACSNQTQIEAVRNQGRTAQNQLPPKLPDLGEAPELTNEIWLNTSKPLRLADLRGQVVLLEMWTFG